MEIKEIEENIKKHKNFNADVEKTIEKLKTFKNIDLKKQMYSILKLIDINIKVSPDIFKVM